MNSCLSDLKMDRLLAMPVATDSDRAHSEDRAHLESCERCRTRFATLTSEREAFLQHARPQAFADDVLAKTRGRKQRWVFLLAPFAVGAAALVFFFRPTDEVRFKGDALSVELFVRSGEKTVRYASEQRFQTGDTLQLAYTSAKPRYLTVVDIDAQGKADLLYQSKLPAATRQKLDRSWVLDDGTADERFFFLISDESLDESSVRNAATGIDVQKTTRLPMPTAFQESFFIARRKAAP